jgi:hypothetical protein
MNTDLQIAKTKEPWYTEHGVISVAVQSGGPGDGGIFETKIPLFKIIKKTITNSECSSIRHYAIVFRVAGEFANWGEDKIERIRRNNKIQCISCDIVVGQKTVKSLNSKNVRDFTCGMIKEGLIAMIERIKKDKDEINGDKLMALYDKCVTEYNASAQQ